MTRAPSSRLLWATLILVLAMFSRTLILNQVHIVQDEARSILRSLGTISEIIAWQPLDWPPLYNLLLGGWQTLIGQHPAVLRMFSVLVFLPGAAVTYQFARKVFHSEQAGWGAIIAYSALGYSVFLSSFLRGYIITLAVFPALLLLTIRYFDCPSFRRAVPLIVALTVMYYTTYTSIFAVAIAGLYTLIVYRQAVWRWWLPGVFSLLLVLPELISKLGYFQQRVEDSQSLLSLLPPVPEGLATIYGQYAGQASPVWFALFAAAGCLLLRRQRNLTTLWLFGWALAAPLSIYLLFSISFSFIFSPRYIWWGLLPIALIVGGGLAYLPRRTWIIAQIAMLGLMFVPLPLQDYREDFLPWESTLSWLRENALPGDVLVVDSSFCLIPCGRGDAWVYYTTYYLKDVLQIVDDPADYPRVWYLKMDGQQDRTLEERITTGRLGSKFAGPWDMLVRLYEAPPNPEGILFENGLRFHGFQVLDGDRVLPPPYDLREQSAVQLRLWWSTDRRLDAEYSISTTLIPDGTENAVAQTDSAPRLVHLTPNDFSDLPQQMTGWEPGEYYVEERFIEIPSLQTWYASTVYLIVYQWWDGVRIPASVTDADDRLPLAQVLVNGW